MGMRPPAVPYRIAPLTSSLLAGRTGGRRAQPRTDQCPPCSCHLWHIRPLPSDACCPLALPPRQSLSRPLPDVIRGVVIRPLLEEPANVFQRRRALRIAVERRCRLCFVG